MSHCSVESWTIAWDLLLLYCGHIDVFLDCGDPESPGWLQWGQSTPGCPSDVFGARSAAARRPFWRSRNALGSLQNQTCSQVILSEHLETMQKCLHTVTHSLFICRQWLIDAVPAIGTHVALRFIKDKVMANELTAAEAAQALIASVHMVTADTEAVKLVKVGKQLCVTLSLECTRVGNTSHSHLVQALATDSKILANPVLRKIVLLGYGTMIFKHCAEEAECPADLIRVTKH